MVSGALLKLVPLLHHVSKNLRKLTKALKEDAYDFVRTRSWHHVTHDLTARPRLLGLELTQSTTLASFLRDSRLLIVEKFIASPSFLWIPIALTKIYFFHVFLIWQKYVCI